MKLLMICIAHVRSTAHLRQLCPKTLNLFSLCVHSMCSYGFLWGNADTHVSTLKYNRIAGT